MRNLIAAAALVLPTLAGVTAASPARADCTANTFCLYPTSGYQGQQYGFRAGPGCWNLNSPINNDANAMRNYIDATIIMWDFPGCSGSLTYTAQPLSYDSNFNNNGFTDKASSYKRI
jgi:hypothetical protein